jgi:hypothetical protein
MPLKNEYTVTVNGIDYIIPENDVLIVPPGELHSMPAIPGRRIIFQCDNSILGEISALEPVMRSLNSAVLINADMDKELHVLAKKTMLDILSLYNSKSELADVKIYVKVIELFMALREYQLEQQKIVMDCDDEKIDEYSEKFGTVLKYIDNNFMYDITLEQLADVEKILKRQIEELKTEYSVSLRGKTPVRTSGGRGGRSGAKNTAGNGSRRNAKNAASGRNASKNGTGRNSVSAGHGASAGRSASAGSRRKAAAEKGNMAAGHAPKTNVASGGAGTAGGSKKKNSGFGGRGRRDSGASMMFGRSGRRISGRGGYTSFGYGEVGEKAGGRSGAKSAGSFARKGKRNT